MGRYSFTKIGPYDTFMDTKRCAYCHKLVRADAHICSGCGRPFVPKQSRPSPLGGTQPSLPAASPHRAGHYSGLHPEDQPYQSSKIAIQRPIQPDADPRRLPRQEPAELLLPGVVNTPPSFIGTRQMTPPPDLNDLPLEKMWASAQDSQRVQSPQRPQPRAPLLTQERAIPVLLTLACIFFIIASSILTFVLLGKRPTVSVSTTKLVASPTELRVHDLLILTGTNFGPNNEIKFTYDGSKPLLDDSKRQLEAWANDKGSFQVTIYMPAWKPGAHTIYATDEAQRLSTSVEITIQSPPSTPPQLQLSASTLDLGPGRAGVVSSRPFILKNVGGGQISWQAQSDATWLTATPNTGTFFGSQPITILVNRSSLIAQAYTGHISFVQQTGAPSLTLTVTMTVVPAPGALNISQAALAFSANQSQGASPQTITLQNSGGEPLNWNSNVSTGDGNPWLSVTPTSGRIDPNTSSVVTVSVQPQLLQPGPYTGAINFTGGASAQVTVALTVLAPGYLSVGPSSLSFTTFAGQNPGGKTITLQNMGGLPLNWTATVDTSSWLSITPISGFLDPGAPAIVTVNVNGTVLTPDSYQGTITFKAGSLTPQVGVALTVNPAPMAAITIQNTPLSFTTYKGSNPPPQTFAVTNTGNALLNWVVSEDGNGATFAPVTPTGGQLAPGKTTMLTVNPKVLGYGAGTLTTVITVADSDVGTKVPSQKLSVTIIVLDQAAITLSASRLNFTNSSSTPDTSQLLTITNSGSANLNWSIALNEETGANVTWLSVDLANGTLIPGAQSVINVHCNSSQLPSGTYKATLTVSDSDLGTPVAPQTVQITLVVQ